MTTSTPPAQRVVISSNDSAGTGSGPAADGAGDGPAELALPLLDVRTRPLEGIDRMLPHTDPTTPLVWVRRGDGMVGRGEVLRLEFRGPGRIARAAALWRRIAAAARVDDSVGLAGTGLIAFGAFAFADESESVSVLTVPSVVVGRREGRCWVTRIRLADAGAAAAGPIGEGTIGASAHGSGTREAGTHAAGSADATPGPAWTDDSPASALQEAERARESVAFGDEYRIQLLPGRISKDAYRASVEGAVQRIRSGEIAKAVLARDLVGRLPQEADLRLAIRALGLGYADCWTFAVDGLIGASPETLVRAEDGRAGARVLAGSAARGADADADRTAAETLLASPKDREEHGYAVASVLSALEGRVAELTASAEPFPLRLPNLWHLASDLDGVLGAGGSVLDLADALHPTAAVGGTPRAAALRAIAELEDGDRGRYAGPVGWVDADGDGEWAIALRCAQVDQDGRVTAWAGCGIVEGSEPERELEETRLKFRPIVEAFG